MTEVVVVAAARTAIGDYGGAFKEVPPTKLGSIAIKEALSRAKLDPAGVGHVVMGSVIHGEARDMYLSRVAALDAGIAVGPPCLTVNRLCGSGLQAIVSAAQHILLGDCTTAVAGGPPSMSPAAPMLPSGRWGQRMGGAPAIDAMTAALHDPFGHGHTGGTAENNAPQNGFTPEEHDHNPGGAQAVRHGRRRVERGVRRAGDGGDQGPRPRPGEGQPERRRGRARPSDRRHRRDPDGEGALRARAHEEALRAGHHVHRRRAGYRRDLREGLKVSAANPASVSRSAPAAREAWRTSGRFAPSQSNAWRPISSAA